MSINIDLIEVVRLIKAIKQSAIELKTHSGGIQAIDKNADRILASVSMLEINFLDIPSLF